jgi:hypothetical protein
MTVHYVDFGSECRSLRDEQGPTRCSALDLELIRLVFSLPDDARAKLLAFLHLAKDNGLLCADFTLGETGEVHLSLSSTPCNAA